MTLQELGLTPDDWVAYCRGTLEDIRKIEIIQRNFKDIEFDTKPQTLNRKGFKMIPFDTKHICEIYANRYKPVLECGASVDILAWNARGEYPIVVMAKKEDAIPFRVNEHGMPMQKGMSRLYLLTDEPFYGEIEQCLIDFYNGQQQIPHDKDGMVNRMDAECHLHLYRDKILDIARQVIHEERCGLTWEDIRDIEHIIGEYNSECVCEQVENMPDEVYYKEVLKRYKATK